jgi:hypothetical protein
VGTDIYGWVEYWDPHIEAWIGVIKLVDLVSARNYELFHWLFGVHKREMWQDFSPIAADRGLPLDASAEAANDYKAAMAAYPEEFYGSTWISWREIQAIDWDEPIEDRIVETVIGKTGNTYEIHGWRSLFLQRHADLVPETVESLHPGQRWTVGDRAFEVVAMKRRDVLEDGWSLLFQLMGVLASRFEDTSHLRWVVWFDG